jgi:hypothetical protein
MALVFAGLGEKDKAPDGLAKRSPNARYGSSLCCRSTRDSTTYVTTEDTKPCWRGYVPANDSTCGYFGSFRQP